MNLLAWGWGMCIFIMPEVLVKQYFNSKKFESFRKTLTYNWLCAIAGGVYIFLMMFANLVGFSFGLSGLETLLTGLYSLEGLTLIVMILVAFIMAAHLMFAIRRQEMIKYGAQYVKNF